MTNWIGDAVMSLPALRVIRERFSSSEIVALARPWVADLYVRESCFDQIIPYDFAPGWKDWRFKYEFARQLSTERFDMAILLTNSFESALMARLAGIPERIGYARDGRSVFLTRAIPIPERNQIPRHESFYYFELLRRAGWIRELPDVGSIRLQAAENAAQEGARRFAEWEVSLPVIGVSPGAAYGNAKRWIPEHFAEAAAGVARPRSATIVLFGSAAERPLCDRVESLLAFHKVRAVNLAGETSLLVFIDLAAACDVFLTNDSGAMHIASALGVPTVAVFGPTDETATGPSGSHTRVVRERVDCAPCLLRECPIDHRCMTRILPARVVDVALDLLK